MQPTKQPPSNKEDFSSAEHKHFRSPTFPPPHSAGLRRLHPHLHRRGPPKPPKPILRDTGTVLGPDLRPAGISRARGRLQHPPRHIQSRRFPCRVPKAARVTPAVRTGTEPGHGGNPTAAGFWGHQGRRAHPEGFPPPFPPPRGLLAAPSPKSKAPPGENRSPPRTSAPRSYYHRYS